MASWQNHPSSWSHNAYISQQPMFIPHMPLYYAGQQVTSPTSIPPANNPTRSSKYPSLNPILAEDTTLLRFNLKEKPSQSILSSTYYANRLSQVFIKPTQRMRLISRSFPWTIDIDSGAPITVGDIWDAMHLALQEPIVDSEWGFIVRNEKLKKTVDAAMKQRISADPMTDKRPKRIDLLGEATLFRGLEKDDDYAKAMLLPTAKAWSETWVIKLIA